MGERAMGISRLNHAVFYVRDVAVSKRFYSEVLGFTVVVEDPNGGYLFMRAADSSIGTGANHHDIAFFAIGARAVANPAGRGGAVGLYHVAWQVGSIVELEQMRQKLLAVGALLGASDHGVSKSIYAVDPDGAEFEIMWAVPESMWGDMEHSTIIEPLDLPREIARYSEIVD